MGFMKGQGAIRRTLGYLSKGQIVFKKPVKVLAFQYNTPETFPHHSGLHNFVFWHLPQLQYKNPQVHIVTFNMLTPTPWIKAFLDDGDEILIDCDSRTREEIHDHMKKILGKSKEQLQEELSTGGLSESLNLANFGDKCARQCICEIPGQIPCTRWQPVPLEMRGKYKEKMRRERLEAQSQN